MKTVLSIAGSDSGGGAGIQADLKTFSVCGTYGATVLTAVTAQNTVGVQGFEALPPDFVGMQLDSVLSDLKPVAVKTGMLANAEIIRVVAEKIRAYGIEQLVIDPVMVAASGDSLMMSDAEAALRDELLPLGLVVTPNVPETEVLTGRVIKNIRDMKEAAVDLYRLGARAVVIKGGHLDDEVAVDVFYDGDHFTEFSSPRIDTSNIHGTGCTFAAALAAGLARGLDLMKAVQVAKDLVTAAIKYAFQVGAGCGPAYQFASWRGPKDDPLLQRVRWFVEGAGTYDLQYRPLYLVLGTDFLEGRDPVAVVREAVAGGVDIVQLREKTLGTRPFLELARKLRQVTRETGTIFLINDRADIAAAVDADGVHVGQDDLPVTVARGIVGPGKIVGVSAGNLQEALRAEHDGADYIGLGPVYPTGSKDYDELLPVGLENVSTIISRVGIPVYVIGGINSSRLPELVKSGINGAAVISAILGEVKIEKAARQLKNFFRK